MNLEYNNNPKNTYTLDGVVLENIDEEKDLGVRFRSDINWDSNIRACIKAANRTIAWISRNLIDRDIDILRNIYKVIISIFCVFQRIVVCHSVLRGFQIKLQKPSMRPLQD